MHIDLSMLIRSATDTISGSLILHNVFISAIFALSLLSSRVALVFTKLRIISLGLDQFVVFELVQIDCRCHAIFSQNLNVTD